LWAAYSHTVRPPRPEADDAALAEIIVRRDRERPELGKAPRHVLDVFVQAEDFHRYEHDRRVARALRPREIAGHVAVRDLDLGIARIEAFGVGLDDVCAHRTRGQGIACGDRGRRGHEATA